MMGRVRYMNPYDFQIYFQFQISVSGRAPTSNKIVETALQSHLFQFGARFLPKWITHKPILVTKIPWQDIILPTIQPTNMQHQITLR